ncbi:hypothetical protein SDC9_203495 [bioreactor metagenome]|uniref:Uncharacterized protein n=1 Tax=bioreactor metagenome TaxID=1076179 RepID=A0A645IWV2_9ZZZZ
MIEKINKALNFSWDDFTFLGRQIWGGGSIQLATLPRIPELAAGGIVQSDTLARIGENGREAVLPLDRNTGWMERLAGMIGSGDNRDVLLELRTQNQLLRALLAKEGNVVFAPSTEAGRWASRSMDMYELARG